MAAIRDAWFALWSSRLVVWVAGAGTAGLFGLGPVRHVFDPPGTTRGFGWLGDLLVAPAARWDSAWYLVIAHYGYRPDLGAFTAARTAFFPLYPLGLSALTHLGVAPVLAGVAFSMAAFSVALYGLHRLTTLETVSGPIPIGSAHLDAPAGRRMAASSGLDVALPRLRPCVLALLDQRTPQSHAPYRDRPGGPRSSDGRLVVLLTAMGPMAFYFSAVYSESLYLALSVGVFLCARRGKWAYAAALAGLASATRSAGLVLVVPLVLLYLYGPREDRAPDRPRRARDRALDRPRRLPPDRAATLGNRRRRLRGGARMVVGRLVDGLYPRYRLRRDALWLALAPAGLAIYMAYLGLNGGEPFSPLGAQAEWGRHFAGPFFGVWDGAQAAFQGARQLVSMQRAHVYFSAAGGNPFIAAGHNLMLFGFLVAAVPLLVGVVRRMPFAYGAYAIAALALPLSCPVVSQPLMSLPRFLAVLFPLNMWLARWLDIPGRARVQRLILGVSGLGLVFFTAEFATWHWVA